MARKVRQMRRKGQHVGLVPAPVTTAPDIDAGVALIHAVIPVALDKVMEELKGRRRAPGRSTVCASGAIAGPCALDPSARLGVSGRPEAPD
jgi:hypothetical protein